MNKVAIITAASKGMGAACAHTLAKEKYNLVLMSRTDGVLEFAKELDAVGMVGNVTKQNDLCKVVDLAMDTYGQIDAIVNISSYSAKDPNISFPTSSTIRAGLSAFVKLFADQYAKDGIRMNNILPGFVDSFDVDDEIRSMIPSKREGRVDEIANTVVFLLSDKSSSVSYTHLTLPTKA